MNRLRILVADDNQFMRTAYKRILETQDEFEVVCMAEDGAEALEMALELVPDVAILDVMMPKMDGIEAARQITDRHPQTGIVLISAFDDLAFVSAIMKGGATRRAYILKNSLDDIAELIRVVEAVVDGRAVLDPRIVQKLMALYNGNSRGELASLTESEENVLKLMLEGYDEPAIAQSLGLPREPVEALASSACEKLGLTEQNGTDRTPWAVEALVNRCVA